MSLIRWSPLEEMELLRKQIDSIFTPIRANHDHRQLEFSPMVEVTETPKQYCVRVMIPGIAPEKIELNATERSIALSGELQPRELEKDEVVHISEFKAWYGKFSKQLNFPEPIEHEKIEACYELGILNITLPKAEYSQRKSIPIQVTQ